MRLNFIDFYALGGLLVAIVLIFSPFLLASPTPVMDARSELGTDLPREMLPLAHFVKDTVREEGEIPLWRPYLLSGAPLVGHPVAPIFYPPNALVLILSVPLALNLLVLLHLWWGGVGFYLHLRLHGGFEWLPSLIGATIFALAPKTLAHISGGHYPMIAALGWFSWAWFAFTHYWQTHSWRWSLLLGVCLAAIALNDGRVLLILLIWLGICTLGYLQEGASWKRIAMLWLTAIPVMVGLAAIQLFPLLELLPYTNRSDLTYDDFSTGSLPPLLLMGILFPADLMFPEWYLYPGALALLLAVYGWTVGWGRQERWWGATAFVGLVMSLGTYTPLFQVLYLIPGFSLFRVPPRWWLLTMTAIAVLATYGINKWLNGQKPIGRRATVFVILLAIYLPSAGIELVAALPFASIAAALIFLAGYVVIKLLAGNSRQAVVSLLLLLFLDTGWVTHSLLVPHQESEVVETNEITAWLTENAREGERIFAPYSGLSPTFIVQNKLSTVDGYDPFLLKNYARFVEGAVGCDFRGYAVSVPAMQSNSDVDCEELVYDESRLAVLNMKYLVLPDEHALPTPLIEDDDLNLYVLDQNHRYFIQPEQSRCDTLKGVDVLETQHFANEELIRVQSETAGFLVRPVAWFPGWRVWVDGSPAHVYEVHCGFQGVRITEGQHAIRFEYAPLGYRIGKWVSLASVLGLSIAIGLLWFRDQLAAKELV